MRKLVPQLVSATVLVLNGAAAADEPATHACAEVADPLERLSCYDKAFPPRAAQTRSAPGGSNRSLPPEEFGFTDAERRRRESGDRKDNSPQEVRATVSTLKRRQNGMFTASLDNGQSWAQTELDSKARLKPGDAVVIRRAAFGSYLLVTPDGIGTRVKRIE